MLEQELGLNSGREHLQREKARLEKENKSKRRSVLKAKMEYKKDQFKKKLASKSNSIIIAQDGETYIKQVVQNKVNKPLGFINQVKSTINIKK